MLNFVTFGIKHFDDLEVFFMDTSFDKKNFIENFKHNCDRVKIKKFIKGDTITTYIEKRNQLCIVLSGEVNLIRYDINGNKTIISHFVDNDIFGEIF